MKGNKRTIQGLGLVGVMLFGLSGHPAYGAKFISAGMSLPPFTLSGPSTLAEQQYLGLKNLKPFELSQVSAKLILIEVFEAYCGICHEQAPISNKLFNLIMKNSELNKDIKMIGIGAGNNAKQVGFFRTKNHTPFPLFTDPNFEIHRKVGSPGVPFHILIDSKGKVLLTEIGLIEDVENYLREIMKFHNQQ